MWSFITDRVEDGWLATYMACFITSLNNLYVYTPLYNTFFIKLKLKLTQKPNKLNWKNNVFCFLGNLKLSKTIVNTSCTI